MEDTHQKEVITETLVRDVLDCPGWPLHLERAIMLLQNLLNEYHGYTNLRMNLDVYYDSTAISLIGDRPETDIEFRRRIMDEEEKKKSEIEKKKRQYEKLKKELGYD